MTLFQNVEKSLLFNYTHSIVVFHTFLLLSLFLFKSCSNLRSKVVSYSILPLNAVSRSSPQRMCLFIQKLAPEIFSFKKAVF